MFTAAFLVPALLASTALAVPSSKARLASRLERRAARHGKPLNLLEAAEQTNATHVSYSSNWAGAVYSEAAGTFSAITGTFTVPTPSTSGSGTHSASAWVGIDGDSCENAILQTGVDFNVDGDKVTYDAWYEWYPAVSFDFDDISFSAGDVVKLTVTATTTKAGKAVIENTTTGRTVSKSITSSHALCQQDAEWIVEDFEEGSSLVPFADFGTVEFKDASATSTSGKVGPSDASLIDIKQTKVLTTSSVGDTTVTVTYK